MLLQFVRIPPSLERRSVLMTTRYMVGTRMGTKSAAIAVEADDALIAALKVKQLNPAASITYVRKHNVRGDRRHPHRMVSESPPSSRSRGSR
jgi:hypothetical protein